MSRSILKKSSPIRAVHLDIPEVDDETSDDAAQSEQSKDAHDQAEKNEEENPTAPSASISDSKKEEHGRRFKNKNLRAVDSIRVTSDRMGTSPRSRFLKKRKQNETGSPRLTPRMGNRNEGETCFPFPDETEVSPARTVESGFRKRGSPLTPNDTHSSVNKDCEPSKPSNESGSFTKATKSSNDRSPTTHESITNTLGAVANTPVISAQSETPADDMSTDEPIPGSKSQHGVALHTAIGDLTSDACVVDSSNKVEETSLDHNQVLHQTVPVEDNDNFDASGVCLESQNKDTEFHKMISMEGDLTVSESPSDNIDSVEEKHTPATNETIESLPNVSAIESDMDYDEEESLV